MRTRLALAAALGLLGCSGAGFAQAGPPRLPPAPVLGPVPDCHNEVRTRTDTTLRRRREAGLTCMRLFGRYYESELKGFGDRLEAYVRGIDRLWSAMHRSGYPASQKEDFRRRFLAARARAVEMNDRLPAINRTYLDRADILWNAYCSLPRMRCPERPGR